MNSFHCDRGARRVRRCVSARSAALLGLAAGGLLALAAPAGADISPIIVQIQASNANGTGTWTALLEQGQFGPGGTYGWSLNGPVDIQAPGGAVLATLSDGDLFIIEDPVVSLGFSVRANAADTTFVITSALVSFPGINPAFGQADGSITATDLNGNGVSLTGLHNGSMIAAQYNGLVPGGATFEELIAGPLSTAEPFGTLAASAALPVAGFGPIAGTVTDISIGYHFTLSAGDLASGTATFVVVPGPGAAGLLGAAAAAGVLRRRRR